MSDKRRETDAGIEIRPIYGPDDIEGFDPARELGLPGEPPSTRGVNPSMNRGRLWTMRQFPGLATANVTNPRFLCLAAHRHTGLSIPFDLPPQMGFQSDLPPA